MANLVAFEITDAGGEKRNFTVPVNADATLVEIQAFMEQVADPLDDVSGGRLTAAYVTFSLDIAGIDIKSTPVADAKIWMAGRYGFSVTGTPYRASLVVPSCHPSVADNNDVIANAGVAANFIAALLSGTNAQVVNHYDMPFAAFLSGKRVSRK